jgi:hypothetical protein
MAHRGIGDSYAVERTLGRSLRTFEASQWMTRQPCMSFPFPKPPPASAQ